MTLVDLELASVIVGTVGFVVAIYALAHDDVEISDRSARQIHAAAVAAVVAGVLVLAAPDAEARAVYRVLATLFDGCQVVESWSFWWVVWGCFLP